MCEVLEYSWVDFLDEMEEARDLGELTVAQERYLNVIVQKLLLWNDLIIYLKHCFHCLISFYALGVMRIDYIKVPMKCR